MPKSDELQAVISSIYDAPLLSDGWETALSKIARFVGDTEAAVLEIVDYTERDINELAFVGYDGDSVYNDPEMRRLMVDLDVWGPAASLRAPEKVLWGSDLCDPQTFAKSAFRNEVFKHVAGPCGLDVVAASLDIGGTPGLLAVYGSEETPVFEKQNVQRMEVLHNHIQRAVHIQSEFSGLRAKVAAGDSMLDSLPYGVVLLDQDQRIVQMNAEADRMLQSGEALTAKMGRLHAVAPADSEPLRKAIKRATGPDRSAFMPEAPRAGAVLTFTGATGRSRWTITVAPLSENEMLDALFVIPRRPQVAICISNDDPLVKAKATRLAIIHGLTPREKEITASLASGALLTDIAEETGRSIETLRSQLKSIFVKTGARSQSDLLRMVLTVELAG